MKSIKLFVEIRDRRNDSFNFRISFLWAAELDSKKNYLRFPCSSLKWDYSTMKHCARTAETLKCICKQFWIVYVLIYKTWSEIKLLTNINVLRFQFCQPWKWNHLSWNMNNEKKPQTKIFPCTSINAKLNCLQKYLLTYTSLARIESFPGRLIYCDNF